MSAEFEKWLETEGRLLLRAAWDAGFAAGSAPQLQEAPPADGLTEDVRDLLRALWEAAPEKARERSSRKLVAQAWKALPKKGRPTKEKLLESMALWKRADTWRTGGGEFVPGLHRWIKEQRWEDPPASVVPARRRPSPVRPQPVEEPHTPATIDEVGDILAEVSRRRKTDDPETP